MPPTATANTRYRTLVALLYLAAVSPGCASYPTTSSSAEPLAPTSAGTPPGMFDAGEATWNLEMLSTTPPPGEFVGAMNSDLAFTGNYAIQGNFNGIQVWDISDPVNPVSVVTHVCPASQSDVSVYGNLLFVSGEDLSARLDCSDEENVYIYVSGSSSVRPADELAGCSALSPDEDPNSSLFRIEVIRVPLDNPAYAAIVSSPRIFQDLVALETHGPAPGDIVAMEQAMARMEEMRKTREEQRKVRAREARERGDFGVEAPDLVATMPAAEARERMDSIVAARGGEGPPTAADSAVLRDHLESAFRASMPAALTPMGMRPAQADDGPRPGPTQCYDITVYPAIGLAGGACGGYGLLLDISDPANPVRIDAVADSNFAYWHSATFSNDGSKILFTDEWGGGLGPKCRVDDPMEWGANAIFTIDDGSMVFQSYFKMPAAQTTLENCVAHNGSLIPVPGRDIMVQGWYQGGISLMDWTDPGNPVEIGYHDRGPFNGERMQAAGSWSVYWYNGVIVNSEIARGLDIFELVPSDALTQNEIDAANSVRLKHLNSQGQPVYEWPATFALARAYLDQRERGQGLPAGEIASVRTELAAENASGKVRGDALRSLARSLNTRAANVPASDKIRKLADAIQRLADGGN